MSKTHRVAGAPGEAEERGGLLIGQLIGDYRLQRVLGRGGMGLVFEGIHQRMEQRAAIKIVHAQLAQSPLVAARFLTEARAASMLDHPGVVRVFDVGQTPEGVSYIVMEYLDGVLLTDHLSQLFSTPPQLAPSSQSRPAHAEFALRSASQLAETLSALHEKGVVHRDLKPDNMFLIQDGRAAGGERIKIFDFGIAKLLCEPLGSPGQELVVAPRTAIGTVLGTPVYMSPEQWQGRAKITDRVDVYAAGGIFYELLAGHPPFTARAIGELMVQHLHDTPPALRSEAPWVPEPVAALIHRMLDKTPALRPSMKEVADFFAHYQAGAALVPAVSTRSPATLKQESISTPWVPYTADLATCQTQLLAPRTSETSVASAHSSQPESPLLHQPPQQLPPGHPPAPQQQEKQVLGVLLACLLGLLLTSMAAWLQNRY